MSSLLATTSLKASRETKSFARKLAVLFGARYENRGRMGLEKLEKRMRSLGLKRLLVVKEKNAKPFSLNFWENGWLSPALEISSESVSALSSGELKESPKEFSISFPKSLEGAMDFSESFGEKFDDEIRASGASIDFFGKAEIRFKKVEVA